MVYQAELATGTAQDVNETIHAISVANEANSLSLTSHQVLRDNSSTKLPGQEHIQDELKLPYRPGGGFETSSGAELHLKQGVHTAKPNEHHANRDHDATARNDLSRSQSLHASVDESVSQTSSAATKKWKDETVKRDHSKLRKGQWTVEEQEYSSRIIYYFDKGLLMLPEGTSLRSYLADKLMCDPMRITKKYAGVSWRTKRITGLFDRPSASAFDIELATAELACLEHRFRLRITKQTNSLLDPHQLASHAETPFPVFYTPAVLPTPTALPNSWSQSAPAQMTPHSSNSFPYPPNQQQTVHHYVCAPAPWPVAPTFVQPCGSPSPSGVPTTAMYAISGEAVALAWAQAAASLTPALLPVAATNVGLQQQAPQPSIPHESHPQPHHQFVPSAMPSIASQPTLVSAATTREQPQSSQSSQTVPSTTYHKGQQHVPSQQKGKVSYAIHDPASSSLNQAHAASESIKRNLCELRRAFESQREHYERQQQQGQELEKQNSSSSNAFLQRSGAASYPPTPTTGGDTSVSQGTKHHPNVSRSEEAPATARSVTGKASKQIISKDDEDAGSILMGFASLLQQSYDEAKSSGRGTSVCDSASSNWKGSMAMSASGDSEFLSARTSNPADSSAYDSMSDQGGKDPGCSSEESDEATYPTYAGQACKRHKSRIGNFTSQNLAEHTTRMAAMYHAGEQQRGGHGASLQSLTHRNSGKHKTVKTATGVERLQST